MLSLMRYHRKLDRSRPYLLALGGLMAASLLVGSNTANAQTTVASYNGSYTTSNGYLFQANAQFVNNTGGNTWSLILSNTGHASSVNGQVLTGFFWQDLTSAAGVNWNPHPSNVNGTATAHADNLIVDNNNSPDSIIAGSTYGNQRVGQHWAYRNNETLQNYNQGISGVGFSLFGPENAFIVNPRGSNPVLNGVDWGIVSGIPNTGLNGNQNPFILGRAVFTFNGQITASNIGGVKFQYGSDLDGYTRLDGNPPPGPGPGPGPVVPEGDGVLLLVAGGLPLVGMMVHRRRRMGSHAA